MKGSSEKVCRTQPLFSYIDVFDIINCKTFPVGPYEELESKNVLFHYIVGFRT